jgi:hypothetical protein
MSAVFFTTKPRPAIDHVITADSFDGEPWPPSGPRPLAYRGPRARLHQMAALANTNTRIVSAADARTLGGSNRRNMSRGKP